MWGPGDAGGRGLDELLVQFDRLGEPLVVLQDAGLDVLAACDLNGTDAGGTPGAARVAAQYAYDPYGRVLSNEHLLTRGYLRAGHKGLFADRLDEGMFTGTGAERPRLKAGARVQYHARNRVLEPELGRWLQSDPNATGLVVLASQSRGGWPLVAAVNGFDLERHFGDGPNLYAYLGLNPWTHTDPLGLEWDPFDFVDEFTAERAGSAAALMADLRGGFDTALYVGIQVGQLHPGVGLAIAAYRAANGTFTAADLLAIVPGGRLAGVIGKGFGSYYTGRRSMRAMRAAGAFGDEVVELHHVIPQFMTGWTRGRTVVLTWAQHQQYHRILDEVLRGRRLPSTNDGIDVWRPFLRANPERYHEVRAALVESVERFKTATQVDMMGDLWTEMTKQGFALMP